MKGAVSRPRVYVRIRPLNERELTEGKGEMMCHSSSSSSSCTGSNNYNSNAKGVLYFRRDDSGDEMQARFDHIFDESDHQEVVYALIGSEVEKTLFSGYNASIFAYGQTGSGKTYTMEGDQHVQQSHSTSSSSINKTESEGLIPRLISGIFNQIKSTSDITNAQVKMSLVQIYQEKIQDLLHNLKVLEIHMDKNGQYVARDAIWRSVNSVKECMKAYYDASAMRSTSSTDMNLLSSRSHMILMINMQWDEPSLPGLHAQLNLIDLAGSERLMNSNATGDVMQEAIHINKSLSALGNVVIRLVEQAKRPRKRMHIPYKDSKLTYLLQSSLGGANLIHFILNVSSSAMWRGETISTIEFGKRALQLVLRPVRNAIDYTRLAEMEAIIEKMRSHIASLEEELQQKRNKEAAEFLQIKEIVQVEVPHNKGINNHDEEEEATREERKRRRRERRQRRRERAAAARAARRRAKMELLQQQQQEREEGMLVYDGKSSTRRKLKRQTELIRIMANLPETFEELSSHCVLFPESRASFRELNGIAKLIEFTAHAVSTYYRAYAAQTIASVIDDIGRAQFASLGGMDVLAELLSVNEERCKEAACVALEAVCRGCLANKEALPQSVYHLLVELIDHYPNQQVQEVACTAVATMVENYPTAIVHLCKLNIISKLISTIRDCPPQVVNLIKAGVSCLGRLAHSDAKVQQQIAQCNGIELLVDILFSHYSERDHHMPMLATCALVNICCGNEANMNRVRQHDRYNEIKMRLLEGLARVFGTNTAREQFGRATAQDACGAFPYFGVTILDKWTLSSSGGRPTYVSFVDNPQFLLYVHHSTNVTLIIQDTLYEERLKRKRCNHAVYMGLAILHGDGELAKSGLKQLDLHGKIIDLSSYTSNCENVLYCHLEESEDPYVVIPFTSERGRQTSFALSAFADHSIDFISIPEQVGWIHSVVDGCWSEFSGRAADGFDWRCNPQIHMTAKEDCRVVFMLSYRNSMEPTIPTNNNNNIINMINGANNSNSSANKRLTACSTSPIMEAPRMISTLTSGSHDASNWRQLSMDKSNPYSIHGSSLSSTQNTTNSISNNNNNKCRPRLHGRLFTNNFAPGKRYVKVFMPLPQTSSFVASNNYSSSSYITTSANLLKGQEYVYVPFTETPFQDDYRVSIFCDSEELEVHPMRKKISNNNNKNNMNGNSSNSKTNSASSTPNNVSNSNSKPYTNPEWMVTSFSGNWNGQPLIIELSVHGKMIVVANCPNIYQRIKLFEITHNNNTWKEEKESMSSSNSSSLEGDGTNLIKWVAGMESYWKGDAAVEYEHLHDCPIMIKLESAVPKEDPATGRKTQSPAVSGLVDVFVFSEQPCEVKSVDFDARPSVWPYPSQSTSLELLQYPEIVDDFDFGGSFTFNKQLSDMDYDDDEIDDEEEDDEEDDYSDSEDDSEDDFDKEEEKGEVGKLDDNGSDKDQYKGYKRLNINNGNNGNNDNNDNNMQIVELSEELKRVKEENTVLSNRLAEQAKEIDALRISSCDTNNNDNNDIKTKKGSKVEANGKKQRRSTSKKKAPQNRSMSSLSTTPTQINNTHEEVELHKTVQSALQRVQNLQQRVESNTYALRKEEMQNDLQAIVQQLSIALNKSSATH